MTLFLFKEGKCIVEKHEKLWTKIKDLFRSKIIVVKINKMIMMKNRWKSTLVRNMVIIRFFPWKQQMLYFDGSDIFDVDVN